MKSLPRVLAASIGLVATTLLFACGSPNVTPGSGSASSSQRPVMEKSLVMKQHALSGCAPGISYGPVLVNGVVSSGAPSVLQISDTSTSSSSTDWGVTMTIDAGPASAPYGPAPSGVTTIKVYDFAGKLIGTYYPNIGGYPTTTTTVPESVVWSPCHLSKATFSYTFNWSEYATPSIPAQSGSVGQTATLTYPAQPTPASSSTPAPTPTPGVCGPMAQSQLKSLGDYRNMNSNSPTLDTDVNADRYPAALNVLNTILISAGNYNEDLLTFNTNAHAADPSYANPQPSLTKQIADYDVVSNDDDFLTNHVNDAARWATTVTDVNTLIDHASNIDTDTEFNKVCH